METLLDAVDFIVLLLLIVHVSRTVWREKLEGSNSLLLTACIAVAACIFGIVSYTSYMGLVAKVSTLTRGIMFLVLLALFGLVASAWSEEPAA